MFNIPKTNKWIEFVKQYAEENGLSYRDAMKEAKQHYKTKGQVNKKGKAITGGGITAKTEKGKKLLQMFEVSHFFLNFLIYQ
jgi:hypothetical protein